MWTEESLNPLDKVAAEVKLKFRYRHYHDATRNRFSNIDKTMK